MKHMLNNTTEDKEKMRADYLAAFERQKQDISSL